MPFHDTVNFVNTKRTQVQQRKFDKKSKRDAFVKQLGSRFVPAEDVESVKTTLQSKTKRPGPSSLRSLSTAGNASSSSDEGTAAPTTSHRTRTADPVEQSSNDGDTEVEEHSSEDSDDQPPAQQLEAAVDPEETSSDDEPAAKAGSPPNKRRGTRQKPVPAPAPVAKPAHAVQLRIPKKKQLEQQIEPSSDDSDDDSSVSSILTGPSQSNSFQPDSIEWVRRLRSASSPTRPAPGAQLSATSQPSAPSEAVPSIFKARAVVQRQPDVLEIEKYDLTKQIFPVVYTDLVNLHEGSATKLVNHRVHWFNRSYRKHALSYATIFDQATCETAFVQANVDLRELKFLELLVRRVLGFYFADVHEDASYLDILALNPTEDVPLSAGFNQIVLRGAKNYNSIRLKAQKVRESAKKRKRGGQRRPQESKKSKKPNKPSSKAD